MRPSVQATEDAVTIWVVEDSAEYREIVQELLDGEDDLRCPHAFASAEDLFSFLNDHFAPELILMDIGLPGMSGIEAARRMKSVSPATSIVMLTIHEDNERIFEAICAGACGYMLKEATPDELLDGVREVLAGGAPMTPQIARRVLNLFTQMNTPQWDYQLTDREHDVLAEMVEGRTKKQMAENLFLSVHTIDTHCRNIYAKLHVHTRAAAVAKALKERLVSDPEDLAGA